MENSSASLSYVYGLLRFDSIYLTVTIAISVKAAEKISAPTRFLNASDAHTNVSSMISTVMEI